MKAILEWLAGNWLFVTAVFLALSLIGFILITFLIEEKRHKSESAKIYEQSTSARTYFIDLPHNKVRFFNITNFSNVRSTTVTQFYSQFPQPGQRKVIDWIKELAYGSETASEFIEVPVTISRTGKQASSMLEVDHVDTEKGLLRISSFLLNFVSASPGKPGSARQIATLEEFAQAISPNLNMKRPRGMTSCFRFSYKKKSESAYMVDHIVMGHLRNALSPLLIGKRVLFSPSENEIILSDPSLSEPSKVAALLREAINLISSYLSLNSLLSEIDFRIGVIFHADEVKDARRRSFEEGEKPESMPEAILRKASETARFAFDGKEKIVYYQRGRSIASSTDDARSVIESITHDKKINYLFRPIYSIKGEKILGYFLKTTPRDTIFETMEEAKNYASKSGEAQALFATEFKNALPRFASQRSEDDLLLFYPTRNDDLTYLVQVLSRIVKAKETKIVFLFNEADLRDHVNFASPDSFLEELTHIKAKGHSVGLLINKPELGMPEAIYQAFDHFACSFSSISTPSAEMDNRMRMYLHAVPERLLRYHKPIIATDVESWAGIGLIVHSGLDLISADLLAKYDWMLEPLSSKTLRKIKDVSR